MHAVIDGSNALVSILSTQSAFARLSGSLNRAALKLLSEAVSTTAGSLITLAGRDLHERIPNDVSTSARAIDGDGSPQRRLDSLAVLRGEGSSDIDCVFEPSGDIEPNTVGLSNGDRSRLGARSAIGEDVIANKLPWTPDVDGKPALVVAVARTAA